ncbi:MAG: hypothetical protein NTW79_03910 [Candidatus Berkelbacteria bacterium]|nr:hypothetical protein [Candidatus Berkelbacteria bacterium]
MGKFTILNQVLNSEILILNYFSNIAFVCTGGIAFVGVKVKSETEILINFNHSVGKNYFSARTFNPNFFQPIFG